MSFNMNCLGRVLQALLLCAALVACAPEENTSKPSPAALTRDDTGYFCGMIVEDHLGPKSQVILGGEGEALWFTTTRDGIAFKRLPEETRPIRVFYVSAVDRGGWEHPEKDTGSWIEAQAAWYVIESQKLGAMGAPEAIPFSNEEAAHTFTGEFGGRVLRLSEIPDAYILGPSQMPAGNH